MNRTKWKKKPSVASHRMIILSSGVWYSQDSVQFDFSLLYVCCTFSATAEARNWIRNCSFALLLASVLSLSSRCLLSSSLTNYVTVCSCQEPGWCSFLLWQSKLEVFLECHIFIFPMLFLRLTRIMLSVGYFFEIYLFTCMYTYWILWNWGCVWLWGAVCVLRIERRSSARATRARALIMNHPLQSPG